MARDTPSPFLVSLPTEKGCAMSDEAVRRRLALRRSQRKERPRHSLRFNYN